MNVNQLVTTVEVSSTQVMAIYKLTKEQAAKYSNGRQFMLKHNSYSDYAYKNMNDEELIEVSSAYFEGFFETEREAYLTAMLVKAHSQIYNLQYAIKHAAEESEKVGPMEFTWNLNYD